MENFQKIAVLIDADNTQLSKLEAVLHEVSTYGRIVAVSYTHLTLPTIA
mgnify:CR=1 FL=1